ncbi:MAG: hypothetical protein MUE85_18950 [Microscillaceae bacterium]|jgi:hypothetical protein|nr:hypothetical protein [Microscillaceae bacterium]
MKNYKLVISAVFSVLITGLLLGIAAFHPIKKLSKTEKNYLTVNAAQVSPTQYAENLTQKGVLLIEKQLLDPLRAKFKNQSPSKIYSRCPSGLQYRMLNKPSEDSPYFKLALRNYVGCKGEFVCEFRVSAAEETIEVLDSKAIKFVSAERWVNAQTSESLSALATKKTKNDN